MPKTLVDSLPMAQVSERSTVEVVKNEKDPEAEDGD